MRDLASFAARVAVLLLAALLYVGITAGAPLAFPGRYEVKVVLQGDALVRTDTWTGQTWQSQLSGPPYEYGPWKRFN